MKTAILCKHCQKEFTPQRSTAIFCCDSCRTKNHLDEKKKKQNLPDKESPPPLKKPSQVIEEPNNLQVQNELNSIDNEDYDIGNFLLLVDWEHWEKNCGQALIALIKPRNYNISLFRLMFPENNSGPGLYPPYDEYLKKLNAIRKINFFNISINKINIIDRQKFQEEFYDQQLLAKRKINEIKQNGKPLTPLEALSKLTSPHMKSLTENETKKEVRETSHESKTKSQNMTSPKTLPDGNIISSTQLKDLKYESISFNEKWKNFLGLPSSTFQCVIHGMPGEGKSTFAIQFAHYLAENFGKVVYISGEEGFNKTLRDKFFNVNAVYPDLHIADIKKYEEIYKGVKTNAYNFILIDSLDTMGINAEKLRSLREHYPKLALITISQSTKDGKIRGSNEIVHDVDIAIKVEDGMAITTKNRFHEKGKKFDVFEVFNN